MEENKLENFGGVYKAAIGGALLGMAIVDQVTKTIVPTMQKLSLSETLEEIKMLPDMQEKRENDKKEKPEERKHDEEYKKHENEVSELKRKIAELEGKKEHNKSEE